MHKAKKVILWLRHSALVAVLLTLVPDVAAQLNSVPLKRDAAQSRDSKPSSKFRKQSDHILVLPFWDDFSFTRTHYSAAEPEAGYPLDSLWEKSGNVWIKSGTEIDAPSVNVAVLDGLDSLGNAYSSEPLSNGFRDVLTSRPIDLGLTEVTPAERGAVYLSFMYQWKGNGESPDRLDNFRVEFFNQDKEWITIATITPKATTENSVFYDTIVKVDGDQFFHDRFQFRFRNYGRLSGPFDVWNLDYVYLDKGRAPDNVSFEDGALASPAGPLFGPYHSVPFAHFNASPQVGDVTIDVFNLRSNTNNPDPYTYRTTGTFTNWDDGVAYTNTVVLTAADRPVRPDNPLLGPRERFTIETLASDRPDGGDVLQFKPDADSAAVDLKFLLLSNDAGVYRANDTVTGRYILKDYYAYDDGSAEYAVSVNEPDDQAAVRFDILGPQARRVTAIEVYIPRYTVSGLVTADFFVMDSENGAPRNVISSTTQTIRKTDRDNFQRFILSRPVDVEGTFFIGWKGSFTSTLYIGKDSDNNTSDLIWVNPFGLWVPNTTVEGSLMLRPVFGTGDPVNGTDETPRVFSVYPNPSTGSFFISGNPEKVDIFSATGSQVPFVQERQDDELYVQMNGRPGMYLIRMSKGSVVETRKVVIR